MLESITISTSTSSYYALVGSITRDSKTNCNTITRINLNYSALIYQ